MRRFACGENLHFKPYCHGVLYSHGETVECLPTLELLPVNPGSLPQSLLVGYVTALRSHQGQASSAHVEAASDSKLELAVPDSNHGGAT